MRHALWPSEAGEHAREIARYFDLGGTPQLFEVLLACDEKGGAVGVIELSIRPYAEGCTTDRVAFVEGWYVEPAEREKGIGAALMRAAEDWGRSQGCVELASDAEVENLETAAVHRALGFTEAGVIRCFRKPL